MTNTPPTPPGARARVRRHSPSSARYRDQQPPSYTPHDPGVSSPDSPEGRVDVGWTCIRDTHQAPDRTTRRSGQGRVHDGRVHGNVTFDVVGAGREPGWAHRAHRQWTTRPPRHAGMPRRREACRHHVSGLDAPLAVSVSSTPRDAEGVMLHREVCSAADRPRCSPQVCAHPMGHTAVNRRVAGVMCSTDSCSSATDAVPHQSGLERSCGMHRATTTRSSDDAQSYHGRGPHPIGRRPRSTIRAGHPDPQPRRIQRSLLRFHSPAAHRSWGDPASARAAPMNNLSRLSLPRMFLLGAVAVVAGST